MLQNVLDNLQTMLEDDIYNIKLCDRTSLTIDKLR